MKVIQISETRFNELFGNTLDILELRKLGNGTIDVNLNSQVDVSNFIRQLHRQFHYEVVQLKRKLEES